MFFINKFKQRLKDFVYTQIGLYKERERDSYVSRLGHCGKNVIFGLPVSCSDPQNIFLYDNTNVFEGSIFIGHKAKFIMKENSGAAQGLTVITNGHHKSVEDSFKENVRKKTNDTNHDIIIEEEVWIAANVTLLDGVHIGRGANIGAGSVVRHSIPPYAIVIGNPCKIIGFVYSPDEMLEHEKKFYPEDKRTDVNKYRKDYNKFFYNRMEEIKQFTKK